MTSKPKPQRAEKRAWAADKVSRWKVSRLLPSAQNARLHDDDQVAQIAASIEEYGWTMPVLVDETGELIAGHGRVLAAKKLGIDSVPAIVARGWTERQKRAYRIADNRLTDIGRWDRAMLAKELEALLVDDEVGLPTGFTDKQIASIIASEAARASPDTAPKLQGLVYSVMVTCEDEEDQAATLEKLAELGFTCKAVIS